MERSLPELETIVREKICRVCSERAEDGNCGLEQPSACALFSLFPQVAKAIRSVQSDEVTDYIQAIRREVCAVCNEQASDGRCEVRQQVRCSLDAYLLLIVDVIEETTGRKFDRTGVGSLRYPIIRFAAETNL